jgi:SRSO17 transposase
VEEWLEPGTGECGWDGSEVRSWVGWHRYVTLSLFALAVAAVIRSRVPAARREKGREANPGERAGGAEVAPPARLGVRPTD